MASAPELADFLSSVEKRAFKQAIYAVRDEDAALDIVQDAMIKLAENTGINRVQNCPCSLPAFFKTASTTGFGAKKCGMPGLPFFPIWVRNRMNPMITTP